MFFYLLWSCVFSSLTHFHDTNLQIVRWNKSLHESWRAGAPFVCQTLKRRYCWFSQPSVGVHMFRNPCKRSCITSLSAWTIHTLALPSTCATSPGGCRFGLRITSPLPPHPPGPWLNLAMVSNRTFLFIWLGAWDLLCLCLCLCMHGTCFLPWDRCSRRLMVVWRGTKGPSGTPIGAKFNGLNPSRTAKRVQTRANVA